MATSDMKKIRKADTQEAGQKELISLSASLSVQNRVVDAGVGGLKSGTVK